MFMFFFLYLAVESIQFDPVNGLFKDHLPTSRDQTCYRDNGTLCFQEWGGVRGDVYGTWEEG